MNTLSEQYVQLWNRFAFKDLSTDCQCYLKELASPEVEHELGVKAEILRQSEALRRILVELPKLLAQP